MSKNPNKRYSQNPRWKSSEKELGYFFSSLKRSEEKIKITEKIKCNWLSMFGKSKIRADFEKAFKENDEKRMQAMLAENPWLLAEWESKMDGTTSGDQKIVLAALGVMEDEINGPVPIDELSFCLRVDFKHKKDDAAIMSVLSEAESLGYCKKVQGGWQLTPEGGKICDNYLNSHATN